MHANKVTRRLCIVSTLLAMTASTALGGVLPYPDHPPAGAVGLGYSQVGDCPSRNVMSPVTLHPLPDSTWLALIHNVGYPAGEGCDFGWETGYSLGLWDPMRGGCFEGGGGFCLLDPQGEYPVLRYAMTMRAFGSLSTGYLDVLFI